ncbi:protein G6 [Trypanosoma grayi]|uniref:protein G6 n=1 Tax=Trypanosoma grayi TaxID=71804 RepID=UPI0004F3F998|nr:protein G6 [Trypanosoma grayi]KEG12336.1 protein G6 [Trypanosoma grayi]
MRVHEGCVMFERDHFQRIGESCVVAVSDTQHNNNSTSDNSKYAALSCPVEAVAEKIRDYIRSYHRDGGDVNLKFITWLPPRSSMASKIKEQRELLCNFSYALYYVKSFFPPEEWYVDGTRLSLMYNAQRHTPNAKILQTQLRSRAKALQESTNAFEVLMVRDKAEQFLVPEGSRSNYLLLTSDNRLLCSLEKDILIGITLQAVRRAAAAVGIPPIEHQQLFVGDLCTAKGLVVLGTSPGVLPVREIQLYHNEESRQNFLAALDDYEQRATAKELVATMRKQIVAAGGVLRLDSAQNSLLTRLREAYEVEAFH